VLFNTISEPNNKEQTAMGRTANDDRSDSMNPNNEAYQAAMDNHSNQLNPNHEEYAGYDDEEED
jgi:hypothetical protein